MNKASDIERLEELAETISAKKESLKQDYDERRTIWFRRLKSGDTRKYELAEASNCKVMSVTLGLRDELVEKMK